MEEEDNVHLACVLFLNGLLERGRGVEKGGKGRSVRKKVPQLLRLAVIHLPH